jgi:hypothetical protein
VRRNYSASAYRVNSKGKEEVNALMHSRLEKYSEKSLEKAGRPKEGPKSKREQLQAEPVNPRISEMSEENRESGIQGNEGELVRVVEVTTRTPTQEVRTQKIF